MFSYDVVSIQSYSQHAIQTKINSENWVNILLVVAYRAIFSFPDACVFSYGFSFSMSIDSNI